MKKTYSSLLTWLAAALMMSPLWGDFAFAARPNAPNPARASLLPRDSDPLVLAAQQGLTKAGYYDGQEDGVFNEELEQAIRLYQARYGLPMDGRTSSELIDHMNSVGQIGVLLRRLEQVRKRERDEARTALLANPTTRKLLEGRDVEHEIADPTRDAGSCLEDPSVGCLLFESVQSSRAIHRDDLRDWALGELLAAQTRVGQEAAAMDTAKRISDIRLIIVALRTIAETHARAGRLAEAEAALPLIPNEEDRRRGMLGVAEARLGLGDREGAVKLALKAVDNQAVVLGNVVFLSQATVLVFKAQRLDLAESLMVRSEKLIDALQSTDDQEVAMRHLAVVYAEVGKPQKAMELMEKLGRKGDQLPVLVAVAKSLAQAGDVKAALEIAEKIEGGRYRSVILGYIALAALAHQDIKAADDYFDQARLLASEIKLPFARAYAQSQLAELLVRMDDLVPNQGYFKRALNHSDLIEDERLRAKTLWGLAATHKNDPVRLKELEIKALSASEDIESRFSRLWMYAELASDWAAYGQPEQAEKLFDEALKIARTLTNAWAKTRALAKLAAVLADISRH